MWSCWRSPKTLGLQIAQIPVAWASRGAEQRPTAARCAVDGLGTCLRVRWHLARGHYGRGDRIVGTSLRPRTSNPEIGGHDGDELPIRDVGMRSEMIIRSAVYDGWLETLGGAERQMLGAVEAMRRLGPVTMISHRSLSRERLAEWSGRDLAGVEHDVRPDTPGLEGLLEGVESDVFRQRNSQQLVSRRRTRRESCLSISPPRRGLAGKEQLAVWSGGAESRLGGGAGRLGVVRPRGPRMGMVPSVSRTWGDQGQRRRRAASLAVRHGPRRRTGPPDRIAWCRRTETRCARRVRGGMGDSRRHRGFAFRQARPAWSSNRRHARLRAARIAA